MLGVMAKAGVGIATANADLDVIGRRLGPDLKYAAGRS
jgi:hypothetical protein